MLDPPAIFCDPRFLQVLLLEKLPYVPLWYEHQVLITWPKQQGYGTGLDGSYDGQVRVGVTP